MMNSWVNKATVVLIIVFALILTGCTASSGSQGAGGTAWGSGAFQSNGERIYFTGTSERGAAITYTNGPPSKDWMLSGGQLACATCHGPSGLGATNNMGTSGEMEAKDIRWKTMSPEFDADKFRAAVVEGKDPDGTDLNAFMPRWKISNEDLADLIVFLKTLP